VQNHWNHDYGRVVRFLGGLVLRFRLVNAIELLLLLSSQVIVALLGSLFSEVLKRTFPYLPFVYHITAASSFLLLLILAFWRLASRPPIDRMAKAAEERIPRLGDDVTNSLLLAKEMAPDPGPGSVSQRLIAAHLRRTAEELQSIDPSAVVSLRRPLRYLKLFVPLLAAFLMALALDPGLLNRSFASITHPFSTLPPRVIGISLKPGDSVLLRGTPLLIRAHVTGRVPESLWLTIQPEVGEPRRFSMTSEGDGSFTHRIETIDSTFRYQAYTGNAVSATHTIRAVFAPDIQKVRLTLIPPEYTRLPRESTEGGLIEALKGTLVSIEAETTKPVVEGRIMVDGNELTLETKGTRLTGSMLVLNHGSYALRVTDELGFENKDPTRYRINLLADKYPEAEIINPEGDVEIVGNEIVPIVYTARDDFGITSVNLIFRIGETERTINLKNGAAGASLAPQTFKWDLGSLALNSGDRVTYRLEVWDNDTVSGPKAGYSGSFTISVRDERQRIVSEALEAERISEAILNLLGDQLEEKKDREALSRRLKELSERLEKHLERMKNDPERFELEALKRNLDSLNRRIMQETNETVTQELERLTLLADEISKRARMNELEAMARELRNRQRRLVDALRDLKGSVNREALEKAMQELKKLQELLQSVMEALSKMTAQLPDEFINSQEFADLDFTDLAGDFDEIQQKLMEGDVAGALEAAQRLLQALTEMMAALQRAGARSAAGSANQLQSEMSSQAGELDRILREQKQVLESTEEVDRETQRLVEGEVEKRLSQLLSRFQEILNKLSLAPGFGEREIVEELQGLLEKRQIERFRELVGALAKDPSAPPEAATMLDELMAMTKNLMPEYKGMVPADSRQRFPDLATREENLRERTSNLTERLEMLAQLFPGMDTEILNDLKEAATQMGNAKGHLKEENAPGAIPPEQEAIRALSKSQEATQQMAQQMMASRMQAGRWAYQLGYDPRAGWYYGPWAPLPTLPQPEVRRPPEKGYTGIDKEEFEPPSKDAYKAPRILREQVMDALKEGVPSQYKKDVERYFRGLAE
jgi:hypothetical protein